MIELKDAYKVLGLDVGASRDEIENRYSTLMRQYKAYVQSDDEERITEGKKILEEISEAYNAIISEKLKEIQDLTRGKPNPVLKRMGVDERKARNVIYYYKYHFIFGLIGVLILAYIIYGFATRVEPDFNLKAIGSFYSEDIEPLHQGIKKYIPGIKEPLVEVLTFSKDGKGQQDYAMRMKAVAVISAGEIDAYIVDKENFKTYASSGTFANLDKVAEDLKIDKSKRVVAKQEEEQGEHVYGIDVTSSKALDVIKGNSTGKIVAIDSRSKNYDKAVKLVEFLLK